MSKLKQVLQWVRENDLIVIDIETDLLDKRKSWKHNTTTKNITNFGIGNHKKQFAIDPEQLSTKFFKALKKALKGKRVGYHNGNFDVLFIWEKFRVTLPITDDSMVLCYLLDESRKLEDLRLKDMAKLYLGVDDWDVDLDTKTKKSKAQSIYMKKDVKYTTMLIIKTYSMLDKTYKKLYRKLMMPVYREYINIHKNGIKVDLKRAKANLIKVEKQMDDAMKKIEKHVGHPINMNSPQQKVDYLYGKLKLPVLEKTEKGNPSTNKDVLKELLGKHPVIEHMVEYDQIKMVQRYLKKSIDEAIKGRLYPTFNVIGTETGRTSCSKPNLQQIPRNKLARTIFTARKGYKFVEIDYSQLELRVACDVANEKTMRKIYQRDGDIHTETGKAVTGKKELTYEERTDAKAVNFGFLYGMLAKGFKKYAKSNYGVILSMQQATSYRQRFFMKYSGLIPWHNREKMKAQAKGYTQNKIGRRRMLPNIRNNNSFIRGQDERRAINTPVQSFANDIVVSAIPAIRKDKFLRKYIKILGTVHDAILFEIKDCPEFDLCISKIKQYMEDAPVFKTFNVKLSVPLKVDVEVGNWGAGTEWKPEQHFCIGCTHHKPKSDICGITGCENCTEKDPNMICPRLNSYVWEQHLGGKRHVKKAKRKKA